MDHNDSDRTSTEEGRQSLASRLGLTIDPYSQDWEWEVADPAQFAAWLAVYRDDPLSDDERFSIMEMLVQCVEDLACDGVPRDQVERMPEWQAIAELLRANRRLHAGTIRYWSVLDSEEPDECFLVSGPMRRLWDEGVS